MVQKNEVMRTSNSEKGEKVKTLHYQDIFEVNKMKNYINTLKLD